MQQLQYAPGCRSQRGSVAIIVALSALVLFGFAGLALDLGRLYVNKAELQSAADACALAAAAELTCDPGTGTCPASFLDNAQAAGIYAAGRNKRDFQSSAVTIAAADVKFATALAPNANYLSVSGGASRNSRYAMCTATATGIVPWFMSLLGIGAQAVAATGVATRAPAQNFCNAAPIGTCTKPGGYAVGEWITGTFTSNNGNNDVVDLSGGFKWVQYPGATGNNVIREQLAGNTPVCGITVGSSVSTPGQQQAAKLAYNTRFGLYPNGANADSPATAPPDHSGYAYPNKAPGSPLIGLNVSAYADYRARQGANDPFNSNEYDASGSAGNISGNVITQAEYRAGTERRLIASPLVNCASNSQTILGMACLLMLNPMSDGATGNIYLEYRGLVTTATGSVCRTGGAPGGAGSSGPQVQTLVQ